MSARAFLRPGPADEVAKDFRCGHRLPTSLARSTRRERLPTMLIRRPDSHRVVDKMGVMTQPEMNKRLAKFGRAPASTGTMRTPGRAVPERRLCCAAQTRGDGRPDAVSTDQRDAALIEHLRAASRPAR